MTDEQENVRISLNKDTLNKFRMEAVRHITKTVPMEKIKSIIKPDTTANIPDSFFEFLNTLHDQLYPHFSEGDLDDEIILLQWIEFLAWALTTTHLNLYRIADWKKGVDES